MSSQSRPAANPEQTRRDALLAATALTAFALLLAVRLISQRPTALAAAALAVLAAVTLAGLLARARVKDWLAGREDPLATGVIIGTRRGNWRLAKPRPYSLGWETFLQHVLISGPTGRGKSFGFIEPILRAHIRRANTGVLYLDGKGDRIDQGPNPVQFDHVFCPEDPEASAHWNPLAGPSPIAAAMSFADALFPAASLPNPVYYEVRGAFAIRAVAPAIAYTGHAMPVTVGRSQEEITRDLIAHGLDAEQVEYLITQMGVAVCEDQLRWFPTRDTQTPQALYRLIERPSPPKSSIDEQLLMPVACTPTVAALHHVLFTDGELEALANALLARLTQDSPALARERLTLVAKQIMTLAALPAKERAAVLSNLENRLAVFLTPPFDRLCSRSDFAMRDVCDGASIAMLLPTGSFPGIAQPLGRIALAQFQQAVLASQPQVTKVAVLDEFHNFVSPGFTAFLSQARSRGGAAVMSTQTITDFDIDYRDRLLANASTQIITPGSLPFDAEHWSRAFGEHDVTHRSQTLAPRSLLEPVPLPSIRTESRPEARYAPTAVTEVPAGKALIRQVRGRTAYPPVVVDVERASG